MRSATHARSEEPPNRPNPRKSGSRRPRRRGRFRRIALRCMVLALVLPVPLFFLTRWLLTPGTIPRTEIAPGVFFESVELEETKSAKGAVMITEVHWDTPGVEIILRPFDESLLKRGFHHRLASPSWLVFQQDCLVLMNTTLYEPGSLKHHYPGSPVRSIESVVNYGQWSHYHEHTYLLWWDLFGNAVFETRKPPSDQALQNATLGLGVQAVQVADGKIQKSAIRPPDQDLADALTFIGIDPDQKILWLVAFEKCTEMVASEFMVSMGVKYAGRMDTGSSTTQIIGPRARGVFPFLGIRNERFVANFIGVRYRKP